MNVRGAVGGAKPPAPPVRRAWLEARSECALVLDEFLVMLRASGNLSGVVNMNESGAYSRTTRRLADLIERRYG